MYGRRKEQPKEKRDGDTGIIRKAVIIPFPVSEHRLRHKKEWFILFAMLYICIVAACYFMIKVQASGSTEDPAKYISLHVVQQGESLLGLAREYADENYADYDAYIREVRFTNHLEGDRLPAGRLLYLPYYPESSGDR